jgi:hypothetical protein
MISRVMLILLILASVSLAAQPPRLAVLTDIGGDPDDQQSLVRLMVYANEFDLELLLASAAGTPGELKQALTRPDLIRQIVDAYGQVLPNLARHAAGWPTADELRARIVSGNPLRGRVAIGAAHDTAGSRTLIARIDAGTPTRPLNITIWGGQTDLAQALWRVKQDRGPAGLAAFATRFRVYDINDQDGIADWIRSEFPGLRYLLATRPAGRDKREGTYRGMYLTGDESLTVPRMDRPPRPQHRPARRPLSNENLDRPQSPRLPQGRRHPVVVFLPPARRQRSRRSHQTRLGRAIRPRTRRLVSRSPRPPRLRSAHHREPLARRFSGRLREAHDLVRGMMKSESAWVNR